MPQLTQQSTGDNWRQIAAQHRPEFGAPGYLSTLSSNCDVWAGQVTQGQFWREAKERLSRWRMEYKSKCGGALFPSEDLPMFKAKPLTSIENKIRRKCHELQANIFPNEGPPVPLLSDLVRTRITCLYLDGVEFIASKLVELATELNHEVTRERQGSLEGYFAQHLCIKQSVFYRHGGEDTTTQILCEIQVATALGTRMWDASHDLYEHWRTKQSDAADWQWLPNDPRFISHQLGHMIHLADGLLVQLRQAVNKLNADIPEALHSSD